MKKSFFVILFTLSLCLVLNTATVFAEESITPYIQPGDTAEMWSIRSKTTSGDNNGSTWEVRYTGYPASQAGETDSISISQSYSASITGTFGVSKNTIEASVGFTAGKEYSFSVSKTSRALKKNEYVKASTRKYYTKYTIKQEKTRAVVKVKYDANGTPILYTDITVIDTATAYAYKPQSPQIKLDYYIKTGSRGLSSDMLTRTEIYEMNESNVWVRIQ